MMIMITACITFRSCLVSFDGRLRGFGLQYPALQYQQMQTMTSYTVSVSLPKIQLVLLN